MFRFYSIKLASQGAKSALIAILYSIQYWFDSDHGVRDIKASARDYLLVLRSRENLTAQINEGDIDL